MSKLGWLVGVAIALPISYLKRSDIPLQIRAVIYSVRPVNVWFVDSLIVTLYQSSITLCCVTIAALQENGSQIIFQIVLYCTSFKLQPIQGNWHLAEIIWNEISIQNFGEILHFICSATTLGFPCTNLVNYKSLLFTLNLKLAQVSIYSWRYRSTKCKM